MSKGRDKKHKRPEVPREWTEKWQQEQAREAKLNGFIYPESLAWLLAKDEGFLTHIPQIWPRYLMAKRQANSDLSTMGSRWSTCYYLVDTWCHGDFVERQTLNPATYKPFTPTLCTEKRGNPPQECISLAHLEEYMQKNLGITPALPRILFTSSNVRQDEPQPTPTPAVTEIQNTQVLVLMCNSCPNEQAPREAEAHQSIPGAPSEVHGGQAKHNPEPESASCKTPLVPNEKPLRGYREMAAHIGRKEETIKKWDLVNKGYAWYDLVGRPPKRQVCCYPSRLHEFIQKGLHRKR